MTHSNDFRWPWWRQVADAIALVLGVGIAIAMTIRNSYPIPGVILVVACLGLLSSSQLLRILTGRWDEKP